MRTFPRASTSTTNRSTTRATATAAALASVALLAAACGNSDTPAAAPAVAAAVDTCDPAGVTINAVFSQPGAKAAELAKKTVETAHPGLTVKLEQSSAPGYDAPAGRRSCPRPGPPPWSAAPRRQSPPRSPPSWAARRSGCATSTLRGC
jgi:hypothetical protein